MVQDAALSNGLPLGLELLFRAASVHRANWDPLEVQRCTLLSIKTGGCTAHSRAKSLATL